MLPVLLEVAGFPIYSYGLMLGLSLLLGWNLTVRLADGRVGLEREQLGNACLWGAIGAVLGARLLYVLINLESFESGGEWLNLRQGGMMAYGGLLGGALAAGLYLRSRGGSGFAFADAAAPALAAAIALTGIGSYLHGSDYGTRLAPDAPELLRSLGSFPRWLEDDVVTGSPAFLHHVKAYSHPRDAPTSLPVHPTQLYELLAGLLLLGASLRWLKRNDFSGQTALRFLLAWSGWRLLVENLRDDPERGMALGFSSTQLLSLLLLPCCAIAYNQLRNRARQSSAIQA